MTEHDKLMKVKDQSQTCGEFLEWLTREKGYIVAAHHEHGDECDGEGGYKSCGYLNNDLAPIYIPARTLLAEFFGIDEAKLEAEKRAMLEQYTR